MTGSITQRNKNISRRDFLKITAFAGLAVGIGASVGKGFLKPDGFKKISETHYLMGTIVNFTVLAPDRNLGENAIHRTVDEMKRLISIFDYRQADTPLARLNREGELWDAPDELIKIIDRSLQLSALSNGAFDITVLPILNAFKNEQSIVDPLLKQVDYRNVIMNGKRIRFARPGMSITLDGIAKGRVVDEGVATLKDMGFDNVLVEAGGDMMTSNAGDADSWSIAIRHPRSTSGTDLVATFPVKNQAVTTSGDYLNSFRSDHSRHHIIDPRKGISPAELSSATVIASNATEADALSTTLMVLGVREGLNLIQSLTGVESLLVTKDLAVHRTKGFPEAR